jgi:phage shock protein C
MTSRTIYRDTERGKIAGVAAGLADHFGWNITYARWGWIIAGVLYPPVALAAYLLMAWLLDAKPRTRLADTGSATAFTSTNLGIGSPGEPSSMRHRFTDVRDKFVRLEQRLRSLERVVTSREFQMDRELRKPI